MLGPCLKAVFLSRMFFKKSLVIMPGAESTEEQKEGMGLCRDTVSKCLQGTVAMLQPTNPPPYPTRGQTKGTNKDYQRACKSQSQSHMLEPPKDPPNRRPPKEKQTQQCSLFQKPRWRCKLKRAKNKRVAGDQKSGKDLVWKKRRPTKDIRPQNRANRVRKTSPKSISTCQ